ncbi:MAG: S9 family peptidase [candidate division Zixibacteria bacterium]|nr:S9 family peptidase [candidate division Zixibacteria bacterium]
MRVRQSTLAVTLATIISNPALGQFRDSVYIPDIETFMQIGGNVSPQVSRDGKVRCFSSGMSGVNQMYRLGEHGWPVQLTYFTDGADFYALSHDGKWAIAGSAVGGSENTNLFLVEVATGRTEALTDLKGMQIAGPVWSDDDQRFFYRTNEVNKTDFHVREMTLATRQIRPVFVHAGYNAGEAVSKDGKWLVASWAPSNVNTDLFLINLADTASTLLTKHEGDVEFMPVGFTPDNKALYVLTNANPQGLMRRATIDLTSKAITFIDTDTKWEVDEMDLSNDGTKMSWVVNEDGYGRLHLYDLTAKQDLPVPALDGIISGVSFAGPDAVVFAFAGAADVPDCRLWNFRTKTLEQWTYAVTAGIDPRIFVRPQLIRYPSFDGMTISGFMYLPPGKKKGDKVPFIVDAHGGPEAQFRPTFTRSFQYYALNGYGVLAINPRGSSGYGREFIDMDNYKNRWKSVKDYASATQWLASEGYADPKKIAVEGGSYGGYMTLACLTANPELYAAGVDQVGIANFVSFLKNTAPYRRALRESEYGPLSDSTFLTSISPISQVDKIKAPLLIVHGENDPRVPVGEARQMAKAIAERGGVVDTLIFPDEGHGVAKRGNRLVLYRHIVDFLNQHLK